MHGVSCCLRPMLDLTMLHDLLSPTIDRLGAHLHRSMHEVCMRGHRGLPRHAALPLQPQGTAAHGPAAPHSGAYGVSLRVHAAVLQLEHVRARRLRTVLRAGGVVQRASGRPAGRQQPHAVAGERRRACERRAPAPQDSRQGRRVSAKLQKWRVVVPLAHTGRAMDAIAHSHAWPRGGGAKVLK